MVQPISGNSNLLGFYNLNKTLKSFESNIKKENEPIEEFSGVEINDKNVNIKIRDINTDEVKQIANGIGERNLSDDDIKYGLYYGRSVIADYEV